MNERADCRACGGQATCAPARLSYADCGGVPSTVIVTTGLGIRPPSFQLFICETCGSVRGEKR